MRNTFAFLVCSMATTAAAQSSFIPLSTTDTGVSAGVLATGATTSAIHMEKNGYVTNQLDLTIAVTPGTSTRVRVWCTESDAMASGYAERSDCRGPSVSGDISSCTPDVREFTLANYTTLSGVKYIATRVHVSKPWAKCNLLDPDGGSGTVTVTGTRSWQGSPDTPTTGYEPAYSLAAGGGTTIDCSAGAAYSAQLKANAEYLVQARSGGIYVTQATADVQQDADSGDLYLQENGMWLVGTHNGSRYLTCDGSAESGTAVYQEVQ